MLVKGRHFMIGRRSGIALGILVLALAGNTVAQSGWVVQRIGPAGRVALQSVVFLDAQTAIAVGTGGQYEQGGIVMRTRDGGASWVFQHPRVGSPISFEKVSFYGATVGMAVGPGGLMRTEDGGNTWVSQGVGSVAYHGVALLDAATALVVGDQGSIGRTTDGGTTWTQQSIGVPYALRAVSFADSRTGIAVGEGGTIAQTTDAGLSWSLVDSPTSAVLQDVVFADGWIGFASGRSGTLLRTTDSGLTWSALDSGTAVDLGKISFADASTVWVAALGAILRTKDGGESWTLLPTTVDSCCQAIAFSDAQTGIGVGLDGIILGTLDGGDTWTLIYNGIGPILERLRSVSCLDSERAIAVGNSGIILRTTDAGDSWVRQESGTTEDLAVVQFIDELTAVAGGSNGIIVRSTDGGATWVPQSTGRANAITALSFVNADEGWIADLGVLHTTDGGRSWTGVPLPPYTGTSYGISFFDRSNGILSSHWGLFGVLSLTTDGGSTWRREAGDVLHSLPGPVRIAPGASVGTVIQYLGGGGTHVYATLSGQRFRTAVDNQVFEIAIADRDAAFVTTYHYIWKLTVAGSTAHAPQPQGYGYLGVCFADSHIGTVVGGNGLILRTETGGDGLR